MKKSRLDSQEATSARGQNFRIRRSSLDVTRGGWLEGSGTGKVKNEAETDFMIDRFKNFDRMAKMEEQKIKLLNPIVRRRGEAVGGWEGCNSNSPAVSKRRVDQQATTDSLDDYYLKAIKAKLSFLDDLKTK
jgi:hypothetical protein